MPFYRNIMPKNCKFWNFRHKITGEKYSEKTCIRNNEPETAFTW